MASGQELAQYYIQIIPSAKGMGGKLAEELDDAGKNAGEAGGKSLVSSLKGMVVAAGIGKLVTDVIRQGIQAGGALEQAMGGVQAILGEDTFTQVAERAQKAAETLGISANTYMEQVTSFSGKLLQDLGGDTEKAAQVADVAIAAMSDNANKMGTSIESVQSAYQGFAKGNFTMLDNLKLGYGGTKTEMERLLADAEAIKKANGEMADYSIDSFSDMVEAIQVVQENMGIAGSSAEEAQSTIQGSMGSLSAAWENFVANMTLGEDIQPSLDALFTTVTNAANNLIPAVLNIVSTLPGAILDTIITLAPTLIEAGVAAIVSIGTGLSDSIPTLIPRMVEAVSTIVQTLLNNAPLILDAGLKLIGALGTGLIKAIPTLVKQIPTILKALIKALGEGISSFVTAGSDMMNGLARGIGGAISSVVRKAKEAASKILSTVKNFFGIHSPSRVFAEIGEMNMLGLAEGIEDNLKPVSKAMDMVSKEATMDFESKMAMNAGYEYGNDVVGSSTNNYGGITINVNAKDGESARDIARKVADILQGELTIQKAVYI